MPTAELFRTSYVYRDSEIEDRSIVSVAQRPLRLSVRRLGGTVGRVIFGKGAPNGRPFGRHKTTVIVAY